MSKKILLADDSITIQKVISITFAGEDYELVVVGDGDAAIAKTKEVKPDLVMADIAMPGKNGYEVCEFIKQDPGLRHIPVLLLSGTFEPLNEKEAQRVKADAHVVKPFESQELIEKVKNLFARPSMTLPVEVEAEKTVQVPETKASLPSDIWDVGDFMGTEETEIPSKGSAVPAEKEMWDANFFNEPAKQENQKPKIEEEFIELELKEDDLLPVEEIKPAPKPPTPQVPTIPAPFTVQEVVRRIPEAAVVESKIKEAAKEAMPDLGDIPKEKLEYVIRKISREVIEEIAWEIIPDMAEEMIKEEIRKIKEAIAKTK